MLEPGTRTRVWLKRRPEEPKGLLATPSGSVTTLESLCAELGAGLDVNLDVQHADGSRNQIITVRVKEPF
jgi:hypothetical protein